jgi:hypothetical protein
VRFCGRPRRGGVPIMMEREGAPNAALRLLGLAIGRTGYSICLLAALPAGRAVVYPGPTLTCTQPRPNRAMRSVGKHASTQQQLLLRIVIAHHRHRMSRGAAAATGPRGSASVATAVHGPAKAEPYGVSSSPDARTV